MITGNYQEHTISIKWCLPGRLSRRIQEYKEYIRDANEDTSAIVVHLIVSEGFGCYTVVLHRAF